MLEKAEAFVHRWSRRYPWIRSLPYWLGAVVVGFTAVAYTKLFDLIGGWMIHFLTNHPYALLGASPFLFMAAFWIVHRFAPAAAGSGIPQVMATLEQGPQVPESELSRLLGFRITVVKIVSSLVCLLGGGVIGREGPTIQIGASLFATVHRRFGRIVHQANPVPWIIAGGAAGLAAAFNTPLGGIVFAIEELASIHFGQFKIAVFSSVIIAGMIAQWLLGPYLYLGFFNVPPPSFTGFGWVVFVAIVSGAAGAYFGKALYFGSTLLRDRSIKIRLFWAASCGFVIVGLGVLTHTNALRPGATLVEKVLTTPDLVLSWPQVGARYIAMTLAYLSGCAGGIFAPSLSMGAAIGAQLARIFDVGNLNLLAMAGMTAFLSAVTRAPFTSAVLVIEMTDRHTAVFRMMAASLLAYAAAFLIDRESFYRKQMHLYAKIPVRPHGGSPPDATLVQDPS